MPPKTIWDVTDPALHSRIQGFISVTRRLKETFAEDAFWRRLETYAESFGIPLPVLTRAVLDDDA